MSDELNKNWLSDDISNPVAKRNIALSDLGKGIAWTRDYGALVKALIALFEEAEERIPNCRLRSADDREALAGVTKQVLELKMPRDERREKKPVVFKCTIRYGDDADLLQIVIKSSFLSAPVTVENEKNMSAAVLAYPLVRHQLVQFLDEWIRSVRNRYGETMQSAH